MEVINELAGFIERKFSSNLQESQFWSIWGKKWVHSLIFVCIVCGMRLLDGDGTCLLMDSLRLYHKSLIISLSLLSFDRFMIYGRLVSSVRSLTFLFMTSFWGEAGLTMFVFLVQQETTCYKGAGIATHIYIDMSLHWWFKCTMIARHKLNMIWCRIFWDIVVTVTQTVCISWYAKCPDYILFRIWFDCLNKELLIRPAYNVAHSPKEYAFVSDQMAGRLGATSPPPFGQ